MCSGDICFSDGIIYKKKNNIIFYINNCIKPYNNYIDPELLSIIFKIELCKFIQYNPLISINSRWWEDHPVTLSINEEDIKKDFLLFKKLDEKIRDISILFSEDIERDDLVLYNLKEPIFKINNKEYKENVMYDYHPYHGLANASHINMLHGELEEVKNMLISIMQKNGIPIPKNRSQNFLDALTNASAEEKKSNSNSAAS